VITYAYFWSFFVLGWILAQLILVATINAFIKNPDRALIAYGLANGALILLFVKLVESFVP
jgi:hypothetical protein